MPREDTVDQVKEYVELWGGRFMVDAAPTGTAICRVEIPLAALAEVTVRPGRASSITLPEDVMESAQANRTPTIAVEYLSDALDAANQELRAPLGVIKGFTTALLTYGRRFPEHERGVMLAEIDGAADTLTALLDDLMELRRLSFGGVARVDDMVDIGEVAVMVAREAAPRHPTQSIEAVVHMAAAGATLVRGDVQALSRLLHILVATALAHSGADARVGITVAQQPGRVELRIEGEGMAIPPDELARFFARPRPSENVPWRRAGALGLRLAIVAGLVAAHAGAIRVENAGTGVAVVVTLPIG